jgi:hypothetical protein
VECGFGGCGQCTDAVSNDLDVPGARVITELLRLSSPRTRMISRCFGRIALRLVLGATGCRSARSARDHP